MGLTLEFDDLALFGYLDELGSEFDAELWVGVESMGDDPEVGVRTVGSGFVMKRWSVRRTSRDDLPTAASPVLWSAWSSERESRQTGDDKLECIVPGHTRHECTSWRASTSHVLTSQARG